MSLIIRPSAYKPVSIPTIQSMAQQLKDFSAYHQAQINQTFIKIYI
jgi:hypothetical protein